ncbi:unnamed protein product [Adineta steineri]|uniref:Uncharacterized protein n=1 Tax=Adineta steineri TaxID=433720 RepID=A0A819S091_9BILA|nr:unnamed protein product [Adineta steineri]CAF1426035.1 unnamed protein product [Adineta steineri]CAF1505317.1 unnamed protein product [Adineta steineri]CAF3690761.1 unnamed protein product [Adineta steineri]CAF4053829.1 unnamed protein product [Adineta steineri]
MLCPSNKFALQLNKYFHEKVIPRKNSIYKTVKELSKIVTEVLHEVESQEPRFISSLNEVNGRFEGLTVVSQTEFEVVLYLNQMGVFNFVDDGTIPGCAVLKLSDGRKRSMSLWVEFITASGYLSARKIRSRFQALVAQACDKCSCRDYVQLLIDTSEVRLRIRDKYIVHIIPAFRCAGLWPRSVSHWPFGATQFSLWPNANQINDVKNEGFNILSKESIYMKDKQASSEGDAWSMSFTEAEDRLLQTGTRRKCLSLLKTLRDRNFDLIPITNYVLKSLVLYECEKHPNEHEWSDDITLGDRLNGILLQLISCLQCRKCPHYFLPNVDLFKGKSILALDNAAKQCWRLTREMLINSQCLDTL